MVVKKNKLPESTSGYSCPNCGCVCSEHSLQSKTEPIFKELPDPHYFWKETHKCTKCETIYTINNGT